MNRFCEVTLNSPYGYITVRPVEPNFTRRRLRNGATGQIISDDGPNAFLVRFDAISDGPIRVPTHWLAFAGVPATGCDPTELAPARPAITVPA